MKSESPLSKEEEEVQIRNCWSLLGVFLCSVLSFLAGALLVLIAFAFYAAGGGVN